MLPLWYVFVCGYCSIVCLLQSMLIYACENRSLECDGRWSWAWRMAANNSCAIYLTRSPRRHHITRVQAILQLGPRVTNILAGPRRQRLTNMKVATNPPFQSFSSVIVVHRQMRIYEFKYYRAYKCAMRLIFLRTSGLWTFETANG